jgi:hypothetical protein
MARLHTRRHSNTSTGLELTSTALIREERESNATVGAGAEVAAEVGGGGGREGGDGRAVDGEVLEVNGMKRR